MSDSFDLTGRRALITGASRGIGLAIAEGLSRRGAALAITGRKLDALNTVAEALRRGGSSVIPVACHQGDPAAIAGLYGQLDREGFIPDIAVINAATNPYKGPLVDIDLAAWQKIIEVNLTGALVTTLEAARRMRERKRGSIILVASSAGIDPLPGLGAYSISKAGLIGMAKVLAKELGAAGVRVNVLAPGLVETRFSSALFRDRETYEHIIAGIPLGRHGQPADVVGAALFLASDASVYVTGQVLVVDGGSRV